MQKTTLSRQLQGHSPKAEHASEGKSKGDSANTVETKRAGRRHTQPRLTKSAPRSSVMKGRRSAKARRPDGAGAVRPTAAELEDPDERPEVAALVVPAARVVVVRDAEVYSFEAAPRSAAPHRLEWVGCQLGAVQIASATEEQHSGGSKFQKGPITQPLRTDAIHSCGRRPPNLQLEEHRLKQIVQVLHFSHQLLPES